jgi:metallothionein
MKCADNSCLCVVSLSDAMIEDDKLDSGEAGANGYPAGQGWGHTVMRRLDYVQCGLSMSDNVRQFG